MSDPIALLAAPLAEEALRLGADGADVALERPADETRGDYASSLALRLAKPLRRPPREIAEALREAAAASPWVASAEVAGPGFLNLRASPAWYAKAIESALEPGFGGGTAPERLKIDVEFVSANPTGPLPVSAGRNAAYGDSLARLLAFAGHDVVREYYFNDAGAQMEHFGRSLLARARGEQPHEEGYQGEYLIAIAEKTGLGPDAPAPEFARAGAEAMFALIRETLTRFRVTMDVWTNEAAFHDSGHVEARSSARAAEAISSSATARPGSSPSPSATTRTASSSAATEARPTSRPISPISSTSSIAGSTRPCTCSVPITTDTSVVCRPPPRPSASIPIASRCRSTRWCTSPRAARPSACRSAAVTSCCSTS